MTCGILSGYSLITPLAMEKGKPGLSVVVPVLNEHGNLASLIKRIHATLDGLTPYEIIGIDDHSNDGSWETLQRLTAEYPLQVWRKQGQRGKAESLRQGFSHCQYDAIAFIDADQQYPPEALAPMWQKLRQADVVVANRVTWADSSPVRRFLSGVFHYLTSHWLLGLPYDVQSGLKMFRADLLAQGQAPSQGWNFDAPFLWQVSQLGKRIVSEPITFHPRQAGQSKVNVLKTGLSLLFHTLLLRGRNLVSWRPAPAQVVASPDSKGVLYRGRKFVTYSALPIVQSAFRTLTGQQLFWFAVGLAVIIGCLLVSWSTTVFSVVVALSLFYLVDVLYMLFLAIKSLVSSPEWRVEKEAVQQLDPAKLPTYSILCPLYKEEAVLEQFVEGISALDWSKDKLDVQLLLEADDYQTRAKAESMALPSCFRLTIIPAGNPRTKPKACNYGLSRATGEYVVIYDAEDIPEPDQLKKVYLAFQNAPAEIACVQAKLSFYNASQNMLTRLFAAEYYLWFGLILPGLQSLQAPIPLGGTSNHFRRQVLEDLHGWDPFNVTEDCDLGMRLFRMGYQTAIIDSLTYEEANSHLGNWLRQRSRWIKGYMQTYLVSLRSPVAMMRQGPGKFLSFHLTVGGKALSIFINPLFWVLTLGYVLARAQFEPVIDFLYPPTLVYIGSVGLIMGNFLYFYSHMLAVAKTGQWWLMKYTFFVPFYWLLMSVAGWYALWQLITRPHYWEKTRHGLHMTNQSAAWLTVWRSRLLSRQRA